MQKEKTATAKGFIGLLQSLVGLMLLAALGLYLNALFSSQASRTASQPPQASSQFISPTPTTVSPPGLSSWKSASRNAPKASFTFKYPPEWSSPYDHCNNPSTSKSMELPPNCIKIVVFTDNLPDENAPPDRDIVLTSSTQIRVGGYQAKRKIFSVPGQGPDTYEVWIYDNGRPIILWLAWIGSNTDSQTRTNFVGIFDTMVQTLQPHVP